MTDEEKEYQEALADYTKYENLSVSGLELGEIIDMRLKRRQAWKRVNDASFELCGKLHGFW